MYILYIYIYIFCSPPAERDLYCMRSLLGLPRLGWLKLPKITFV